jgi:DNA-binding transcriptional ArsR family regulator
MCVARKVLREIGRKPITRRVRQAVQALTFAVNNWIRVEVLAILHEGEFSAGEIAAMIGEDVRTVTGHIHELYESGCIEFVGTKMVGGHARPVYRAIVLPKVNREVYQSMSIPDRRDLNYAVTQGVLTETVSSFDKGRMDEDEQLYLVWDAMTLDALGEVEMHDYMEDRYGGAKTIQARAANRLAKSGKEGVTKCVAFLAFRRGRPGRPEGGYFANSEDDEQ